ncbi:MAG: MlaD family protein [Spirochaetota bacterium]
MHTFTRLVGLTFFLSLALAFYATIIQTVDTDSKYPYRIKLYYSKIDGIQQGTEVSVLGIPAGVVDYFSPVPIAEVPDKRFLEPGKKQAIAVVIKLSYPLTLWDNYEILFKSKTAFSGRSIDIDPGSFTGKTKRPMQVYSLRNEQDSEAEEHPVARYYDDFFSGATAVMKENQEELHRGIVNFKQVTGKLRSGSGTIPSLIHRDELYCSLENSTRDIQNIAKEARWYIEGIREEERNLSPFVGSTIFNILNLNLLF